LFDRRVVPAVPRLRFFACLRCDTVYAEVDPPDRCQRCDAETFEKLALDTQAAYFSTTAKRQ
jgi:rubredoxin